MDEQTTPNPQNVPSEPGQTIVEEIIYDETAGERGGCRGCVYGILGAVGCFVFVVLFLVGAIVMARSAVEGVVDGISSFFSGQTVTDNITLPIIERVQNLQELKTVRYNFSNIVQSEVEMPPLLASLYGDNIVIIAVGHIEAGIDLAQLTPDDLTLEGNTLTITLPAPQILSCYLDEQQTEVVERNRGIFAPTGVQLDNAVRRFALSQFVDIALEDGILLDAAEEGEETLRQLVTFVLGDDSELELVFTFEEADSPPSLPDTCP